MAPRSPSLFLFINMTDEHHYFTSTLLHWYKQHGRNLPWRNTNDAYAIWLSEIILQQTRIAQGTDYWYRFMERYPNVEMLAKATEDEVLRLWQGLGYYSRARNLLKAARQITELGHFPNTAAEISKLKGVGPYTSAAIGSLAFNLPMAAVDGNVYRVLSRYFGISIPINTTEGKHTFQALAQSLLPPNEAGTFNQALMDFGAIQCTPASPVCPQCPLAESCTAYRKGLVDQLPVKLRNLKIRERHFTYLYIRCHGEVAIHRRKKGDIWQGLWEPFLSEDGSASLCHSSARLIRGNVKHVLTHQVIYADFYLLNVNAKPALPDDYIWIKETDFDSYGKPRLVEKMLRMLAED